MPPVYQYQCEASGATLDVVRDVDVRDSEPTPDEVASAKLVEPQDGFRWRRRILPPKVAFGAGWSHDGRGLKGRH